MIVGRIATIVVVMGIGVVVRIHDNVMWTSGTPTARRRRRQHRTITVIVVTVFTGTVVVTRTRSDVNHHPRFSARPVPVEANRLKVLKGGEAVEFASHLVVRHDGECAIQVDAVGRDVNGDSLDATGIDLDVLLGVVIAVVWVKENIDVTPIGVVSNVLHVVVDRD